MLYEITVATTLAVGKFKRKIKNKTIESIDNVQDEPKEAWKNVDKPLEENDITEIIPTN